MSNFRIYAGRFSHSAALLAEALEGKLIRPHNSKYWRRPEHILINWGSTNVPAEYGIVNSNPPNFVAMAVSKLRSYARFKQYQIPSLDVVLTKEEARTKWPKKKIVARDFDRGSGGRGITVYKPDEQLRNHVFYTPYFKKEREFRIHTTLIYGSIFAQEKLRKKDVEVDPYIRSHDRGWVFGWKHLEENPIPQEVKDTAHNALMALGLNFGAVDIGWNVKDGLCVFEVNTAPGIEESSLKAYADYFKREFR